MSRWSTPSPLPSRLPAYPPRFSSSVSKLSRDVDSESVDSSSILGSVVSLPQSQKRGDFRVMIRIRPPLPKELTSDRFVYAMELTDSKRGITLFETERSRLDEPVSHDSDADSSSSSKVPGGCKHNFTFDYVFGPQATQEEVYNISSRDLILSTLDGYNSTIVMYGQTGAGKTYTMEGLGLGGSATAAENQLVLQQQQLQQQQIAWTEQTRGITCRAVDDIFQRFVFCC